MIDDRWIDDRWPSAKDASMIGWWEPVNYTPTNMTPTALPSSLSQIRSKASASCPSPKSIRPLFSPSCLSNLSLKNPYREHHPQCHQVLSAQPWKFFWHLAMAGRYGHLGSEWRWTGRLWWRGQDPEKVLDFTLWEGSCRERTGQVNNYVRFQFIIIFVTNSVRDCLAPDFFTLYCS